MQMLTIGQVAKKYSLSRSTLIYYDSIGILTPSCKSDANYRLYSDIDLKRMEKISLFRNAGLSLDSISLLLDKEGDELNESLEHRLISINGEIQALRNQQKVILKILENERLIRDSRIITKRCGYLYSRRRVWMKMVCRSGILSLRKRPLKPIKTFLNRSE